MIRCRTITIDNIGIYKNFTGFLDEFLFFKINIFVLCRRHSYNAECFCGSCVLCIRKSEYKRERTVL